MSEYSLMRAISLLAGETWSKTASPEKAAHDALVREHGELARPFSARIPGHALRDMSAAGASGSSYLVGVARTENGSARVMRAHSPISGTQ
jgi:hypothetical protein